MSKTPTTEVRTCPCGAVLPPRRGRSGPHRSTCDDCKREQARARGRRETERRRAERAGREPKPRKLKHKPGDRWGSLTLTERLEDHTRAVFACDCGNSKELSLRNVVAGRTTNCADRSRHPNPRRVERPTYATAHYRVTQERGPANTHPCAGGCGEQASHWAYRHSDLDQLVEEHGREAGSVYSANPDHYAPLCRACHHRWDKARAGQAPRHGLSLAHVVFGQVYTSD